MERKTPVDTGRVRAFAKEVYREQKKTLWLATLAVTGIAFITEVFLSFLNDKAVGLPNETLIELLTLLISILITAPLRFGMYELLIRLMRKEEVRARDVFSWFMNGRALYTSVLATVWYFCLAVFWTAVYLIPGVVLSMWAGSSAGIVASVVLMVFLLARMGTYLPGFFLIAEGKNPVYQSIQISRYLMTPYKWDFLLFLLSFVLYLLPLSALFLIDVRLAFLRVVIAAIAIIAYMIFLTPYIYLCMIRYFQEVSLKTAERGDGVVQIERQDFSAGQEALRGGSAGPSYTGTDRAGENAGEEETGGSDNGSSQTDTGEEKEPDADPGPGRGNGG